MACSDAITEAMNSTPAAAMELVLGFLLLQLEIQREPFLRAVRLKKKGTLIDTGRVTITIFNFISDVGNRPTALNRIDPTHDFSEPPNIVPYLREQ